MAAGRGGGAVVPSTRWLMGSWGFDGGGTTLALQQPLRKCCCTALTTHRSALSPPPLLPPRSLSISGQASWVERALMFQILNYSWNICLASRVWCSLLRNLHLAPETSLSIVWCHLSEEGRFLQFRNRGLQAISNCISIRSRFESPFSSSFSAHLSTPTVCGTGGLLP